jgi:tetratricopeptide (TPR) repeat protein
MSAKARAILQNMEETLSAVQSIPFKPSPSPSRENATIDFQQALKHHREQRLQNAVEWYIRAIEKDSSYVQAFYNLGLVYYAMGNMKLAGEAFTHAVDLNPAFTDARYNRALTDLHEGRSERAEAELQTVLRQKPDYQPAIDLLNRIRAQQ